MRQVDVTIVGAGPAGASLGLLLARSGLEVAILDQADEFNYSPKGAMFHPSTLSILESLNLLEKVRINSEVIKGADFFWKNSLLLSINYKDLHSRIPYGLSINYYHLQKVLIDSSEEFENFSMYYGCEIKEITQNLDKKCIFYKQDNTIKEIRSSIIVAADGKKSQIRKNFNIDVETWEFDHENIVFVINRPADWSNKLSVYRDESDYIINVPISKDHLLLIYAIPRGTFENVQKKGINHIKESILKFDSSLHSSIYKSSFDWPKFLISYQGLLAKRWVEDQVLLIGDSAHSMHSLGGQGMNFSLQDAVVAAKVIIESFEKGDFSRSSLIEYEELRKPYVENYVLKQKEFPILKLTGREGTLFSKEEIYDSIPSLKSLFEMHLSSIPEEHLKQSGAWR